MEGIKAYLLRVISCAFLVSLAQAAASGEQGKRAVRLLGGCLTVLVVFGPIVEGSLRLDLRALTEDSAWRGEAVREAEEKNAALLRDLVCAQTEALIEEKAEEYGIKIRAAVEAEQTGENLFVPCAAELTGSCPESVRLLLTQYLERELGIPPDRQSWRTE